MKPFAILLSLALAIASLSLFVWIGTSFVWPGNTTVVTPAAEVTPAPTVEDLPLPKTGPYGKAEIEESDFYFGSKIVDDTDSHVFTIKNGGPGVLEYKMGKPTCQCTVGEITKDGQPIEKDGKVVEDGSLQAGESVNIKVNWKMKVQMERFRQVVPVFTTDPDHRKIELAVIGSVDSAVHMKPDSPWDLGDLSTTEASTAEGIIASKVFEAFTVTEEPRDNPKVKLSWAPMDPEELEGHTAKSAYKIKAEVATDVPLGIFRESIKLKIVSNDNRESIKEFSVTGRRAGPIEVRGVVGAGFSVHSNRLVIPDFAASAGKKTLLTFYVKGFDGELELKSVEPADSPIKVTMKGPGQVFGKSKKYDIQVEIPPGPAGRHRDDKAEVVKLEFNHPDAAEFKMLIDYNATR